MEKTHTKYTHIDQLPPEARQKMKEWERTYLSAPLPAQLGDYVLAALNAQVGATPKEITLERDEYLKLIECVTSGRLIANDKSFTLTGAEQCVADLMYDVNEVIGLQR